MTMAKRTAKSITSGKRASRTRSATNKATDGNDIAKRKIATTAAPKKSAAKQAAKKLSAKKIVVNTVSAKVTAVKKPDEKPKPKATPKPTTTAQASLPDTLPVLPFANAHAWESWLEKNAAAPGLWLKIAKKNAGIATVSYEQALDVALCHGWIDGQKRGFDERYFLQRFTPRRPKGLWSKINIGHVERLTAAGRMRAGGQRQVDAAKADGRWDAAYDGASSMEVPEALALALAKNKAAAAFFAALDKTNRYSVCWRVHTAKTDATRTARVETLVAMLARGEKIHA
jgi:uncharacterized protein YdeI (YjbR/CyaY-like superfamily)